MFKHALGVFKDAILSSETLLASPGTYFDRRDAFRLRPEPVGRGEPSHVSLSPRKERAGRESERGAAWPAQPLLSPALSSLLRREEREKPSPVRFMGSRREVSLRRILSPLRGEGDLPPAYGTFLPAGEKDRPSRPAAGRRSSVSGGQGAAWAGAGGFSCNILRDLLLRRVY